MSGVILSPTDLGRIAGPLLFAHFFSWGLLGVLSVQVYIYYSAFPQDSNRTKTLVYVTYVIELAQTILFTQTGFVTFASGFGNIQKLDEIGTLWFSVPIMSGIVGFIAQVFYAYRLRILAQNNYASIVILVLALTQFSAAIAIGIQARGCVVFSNFLKPETYITAGIWEGGSAICDVVIATFMTYYLRRRRDTGVKQTRALVQKIIRLTIETGTLTATVAVVTVILTLLPGKPTFYQTAVSALGKFYSNSMMVSLNSRMKIGSAINATMTTVDLADLPAFKVTPGQSTQSDTGTEMFRMQGLVSTQGEVPYPNDDPLLSSKTDGGEKYTQQQSISEA